MGDTQGSSRDSKDCGLSNWRGGVAISWADDNWERIHLL